MKKEPGQDDSLATFEALLDDIERSLRDQAESADSSLKKIQELRRLCRQQMEKSREVSNPKASEA